VVAGIAETLSLAAYSPDEQLMSSCPLPFACGAYSPSRSIPVLAGLTHVIVGCGSTLFCLKRGVGVEVIRLPSDAIALCAPPEEYPRYCVVVCDHHLISLWHRAEESRLELLRDDVSDVTCGFTHAGHLVVVDHDRFEIYRPVRQSFNFQFMGGGSMPGNSPIAVLTAPQPNQVLICSRLGAVMRAAIT
jgi:hypothetical protein